MPFRINNPLNKKNTLKIMKFINKNTIKLDKEINELDRFVLNFVKILQKHTDYVIVSGYVAILLGRDMATDDIDIFIPKTSKGNY